MLLPKPLIAFISALEKILPDFFNLVMVAVLPATRKSTLLPFQLFGKVIKSFLSLVITASVI